MLSENERIDGSWELTIFIPEIKYDVKVRVKGDIHVGGVMYKCVENLEKKLEWSDHMLWWPEKNIWLSHTRTSLDQYGVQSNSKLELIKVHNNVIIVLPSLSQISVNVNFCADIFTVVIRICKELCIRFPEELSLQLQLVKEDLKINHTLTMIKSKRFTNQLSDNKTPLKDLPTPEPLSPTGTPNFLKYGTLTTNYHGTLSPVGTINKSMSSQMGLQSCNSLSFDVIECLKYSDCMKVSSKSVFESELLLKPKNMIQKARMNCMWLDSSRSLMEQGITTDYKKPLYFRFKFHLYYDLNIKYDTVRIHQLYEQAHWDILSGKIDCNENDMILFAALQLQAILQTENNCIEEPTTITLKSNEDVIDSNNVDDEVEQMLLELEEMCLGDDTVFNGSLIPEQRFEGSLRVTKVNKLGMKNQKRLWCVLKKHKLYFYTSKDDANQTVMEILIATCHIKPQVNIASNTFFIRIITLNREEIRLQFDNRDDYSNWMAALHLVTRRKTLMNKALFQKEINNILEVLKLQTPGPQPELAVEDLNIRLKDISDFISEKVLKKAKSKEYLRHRIGLSHANVRQLSLLESKMKYIQAWQRLENFGITYVIVKFDNSTKDELIGISYNRLMLINQNSGDITATHFYSDLKSWNINWDAEKVILDFKQIKFIFKPISTNCKTVIELIGGYVFLNQRNPDKSQDLNIKLFHKLTGVTL